MGASRVHIKRAVEASLERLKTDRIDLYQIHQQDLHVPEEEVMRALDELVQEGKVMYFGASNYAAYRLVESLWIADKRNLNKFVSLQAQYSLTERNLEIEHVPAMKKFGMGLLPWSPLSAGFLSGKYKKNEALPEGTRLAVWGTKNRRWDDESRWAILDVVNAAAKELGATAAQVSLAWLLTKPTVTSVIIGVRTLAQMEDNLKSVDLTLPPHILQKLEEVSSPQLYYPYDFMKRNDGAW